ncbi:hypothetical protein ANAPC5_01338 [Anaplasma phagocytophilum]|nr:hypothetical protein ANAPC5_01338 [Anaplasma phagocytophilum]
MHLAGFTSSHSFCLSSLKRVSYPLAIESRTISLTFGLSASTTLCAFVMEYSSVVVKSYMDAWCLSTPPTPSHELFPCPDADNIHLATTFLFEFVHLVPVFEVA